jgi:hypothetical protein
LLGQGCVFDTDLDGRTSGTLPALMGGASFTGLDPFDGAAYLPLLMPFGLLGQLWDGVGMLPLFTADATLYGPRSWSGLNALPMLVPAGSFSQAEPVEVCFAMNMKHNGLSRYENYPFNSMCVFHGKAYGACDDGIMLLEGPDDDGLPIDAVVDPGINDFDKAMLKKIMNAYLAGNGSGDCILTVTTDDGAAHSYPFAFSNNLIKTTRVKIGKGKTGRFWQFRISNVNGSAFELHQINLSAELWRRKI